jgi:hypothetical protein
MSLNLHITDQQIEKCRQTVDQILNQRDPERIGRLLSALDLLPKASPTPDFCYSQPQAAAMVADAVGKTPQAFMANQPWILLEQKGLGEGIGFWTISERKRMYTQEAVDFVTKNWRLTRAAMERAKRLNA